MRKHGPNCTEILSDTFGFSIHSPKFVIILLHPFQKHEQKYFKNPHFRVKIGS